MRRTSAARRSSRRVAPPDVALRQAMRTPRSRRAAVAPRRRRARGATVEGVPTSRVRAVALVSSVLVGLVFLQMAKLQVVNPEAAVEKGLRQRIRITRLAAERGDLVDRSGVPLAISVREWSLIADPAALAGTDLDATARTVSKLLGVDATQVRPRLAGTSRYAVVVRGLDEAAADRVRTYRPRLDGLYLEEGTRRVYPAGDLARGVLGRVNRSSDKGETGLERQLEAQLKGKPGQLLAERGAKGRQIAGTTELEVPPVRGTSYQLTLDRSLQYSVEGMLAASIAITGAKSGTVLVSQVATGDVVVMANMKVSADRSVVNTEHNCALVCVYEPGSVNKAITISAALESGIVSPSTRMDVPDRLQVSDHKFKDDEPHAIKSWTPGEILANSSNVGTIMIAKRLGRDRIDTYLRGFGLGSTTGMEFPDESAGILLPKSKWNGTSIGAVPIGQGLAVTAAQMLDVYNTIANDGVRVPLRLIRGTVDRNGVSHELPVKKGTRVVSERTAEEVTEMLTAVVRSGTGTAARVDGYTVAGKTGTAQKPDGRGGYLKSGYTASFAGFFPAENPVLSAIVILDEPQTSIYGGMTAAPLFSEVARFSAAHFRLAPSPGVPMLGDAGLDVTTNREARATKSTGTWQQALIRRAALSASPLDAITAATGTSPAVAGTPVTTAAPSTTLATLPPAGGAPTIPVPTTAPGRVAPDLSGAANVSSQPRAIAPRITTTVKPVVDATAAPKDAATTGKATSAGSTANGADRATATTAAPTTTKPAATAEAPSTTIRKKAGTVTIINPATEATSAASAAGAGSVAAAGASQPTAPVAVAARPPTTSVEG